MKEMKELKLEVEQLEERIAPSYVGQPGHQPGGGPPGNQGGGPNPGNSPPGNSPPGNSG